SPLCPRIRVGSPVVCPYQFPRADHAQATLNCLDLDEHGADVGDSADARTHSHLVTDVKIHLPTSKAPKTTAIAGTSSHRNVKTIAARNRVAAWPHTHR